MMLMGMNEKEERESVGDLANSGRLITYDVICLSKMTMMMMPPWKKDEGSLLICSFRHRWIHGHET